MSRKEKTTRDFVYKPYYEGGIAALNKFIRDNLVYPKEAANKKIQGTVRLVFKVNHKGTVHQVKVLSGIGFGCDEEAIRIAELIKYQVPKTHKLKVSYTKNLRIHFRVKKEKTLPKGIPQYTYIATKQKSTSYTYTINI